MRVLIRILHQVNNKENIGLHIIKDENSENLKWVIFFLANT